MPFFNPMKFFKPTEPIDPIKPAVSPVEKPVVEAFPGASDDVTTKDAATGRKRGRKVHSMTRQDMDLLFEAIQRRGEAIPADLAQELGWARSTLAYNLNKLQTKGKIVRRGNGPSTRYRVTSTDET
jgi:hypothetical protein